MLKTYWTLVLALAFPIPCFSPAFGAATVLQAVPPVELSGKSGHFDYLAYDSANDRLLAAHPGAGTLEFYAGASGKMLPPVATGAVQGVAIDAKGARYFAGDETEKKIVIVDAKSFSILGEVAVDGPVDAIAFDSKRGLLYADEDDGTRVWVIDPTLRKIVATIVLPGVPEFVEYDPKTDRIYQNIKTKDELVVLDPEKRAIVATWSTLPATAPHGLAVDAERGKVYSAGKNGKLVAIDLKTGKVTASVDIPASPDQIAFDPVRRVVYSACRGYLSAVRVSERGLLSEESVPLPMGAHTLAVDSKRGGVWLAYEAEKKSYLLGFHAVK